MVRMSKQDLYRIVNTSLRDVANDMVALDILDVEEKQVQYRVEQAVFSLAERRERLGAVVTAHNLMQYTNKFYSIGLTSMEPCELDWLIDLKSEDIDLSGLGGSYAI